MAVRSSLQKRSRKRCLFHGARNGHQAPPVSVQPTGNSCRVEGARCSTSFPCLWKSSLPSSPGRPPLPPHARAPWMKSANSESTFIGPVFACSASLAASSEVRSAAATAFKRVQLQLRSLLHSSRLVLRASSASPPACRQQKRSSSAKQPQHELVDSRFQSTSSSTGRPRH